MRLANDLGAIGLTGNAQQVGTAFKALEAALSIGAPGHHINQAIENDASKLRQLARYTIANNPVAHAYWRQSVNNVIGPRGLRLDCTPVRDVRTSKRKGQRYEVDIDLKMRVERLWDDYCRNNSVDDSIAFSGHRRDMSALWHLIVDGECFVWFKPDPKSKWGFRVELIAPERVPVRMSGLFQAGGSRVSLGIEFAGDGSRKRIAYFIKKWTPTDYQVYHGRFLFVRRRNGRGGRRRLGMASCAGGANPPCLSDQPQRADARHPDDCAGDI